MDPNCGGYLKENLDQSIQSQMKLKVFDNVHWVQWKTRNAKPAKKSRGDMYPATGRMENPVLPAQ